MWLECMYTFMTVQLWHFCLNISFLFCKIYKRGLKHNNTTNHLNLYHFLQCTLGWVCVTYTHFSFESRKVKMKCFVPLKYQRENICTTAAEGTNGSFFQMDDGIFDISKKKLFLQCQQIFFVFYLMWCFYWMCYNIPKRFSYFCRSHFFFFCLIVQLEY